MSLLLQLLSAGLAGLVAAVCMTIVETPFWRRWGMEGVAEWQINSVIVGVLIRRFAKRRVLTSMSVAMHMFHGAVLGFLFLVLLDLLQTPNFLPLVLLCAIVYGVLLWIVSPYLTRNFFASLGGFQITRKGLAVSFLGHIIYGIFLGLLVTIIV
jgi:hypothetical protein